MGTAAAGALLLPTSPGGFLGASRTTAPGANQPDPSTAGASFQNHRRLCLEDGRVVRWAPGDTHGSGGPLTPRLLGETGLECETPFPIPGSQGAPTAASGRQRAPPRRPSSESLRRAVGSQGPPGTVHTQDKGLRVNPDPGLESPRPGTGEPRTRRGNPRSGRGTLCTHAGLQRTGGGAAAGTQRLRSREGLPCVYTINTPFPQAHTSVRRRASTNTASSDVTATGVYGIPGKSSRTVGRGSTALIGPPSAGQGFPLAPRVKHGGHQAQTKSSGQSWGPGGARESWSPRRLFLRGPPTPASGSWPGG